MKTIHELGIKWMAGWALFAFLLVMAPSLLEADYTDQPMDRVDGSFTSAGFEAKPFINDLTLFNQSNSSENPIVSGQAMTPQVEHQLTFDVGYEDGMDGDIALSDFYVNIKIMHAESCTVDTPCDDATLIEAFNSASSTDPDAGVFRYNFSPAGFTTITDGALHTWDVLAASSATKTNVVVPDNDAVVSGYAIDFRFEPSKTALEDFANGSWMAMVEFGIVEGPSSYEALTGYQMEWYGEINVEAGTKAIWTMLDVQGFNNDDSDYRGTTLTNSSIQGFEGIQYISNGPYIHTNRADDMTWTSDQGFTATLVTSADLDYELQPQEFMIRVNTLETFDRDLKAIQLVDDRADLNNMLQRSLESGRTKNFHVFVRLAPDFQNATYTGTMDFGISNLPSDERPNVEPSTVGYMFGDGQYPTESVPLSTPDDLAALNTSTDGFIVFGEGTVYERLYQIKPSESDFVLSSDLDLTEKTWTPIGSDANPFTGSLVGNDKIIENLTISGSSDHVGLFGVAQNATFEDLVLTNVAIDGDEYVGGLLGEGRTVEISNVQVNGTVEGNSQVGGIAGLITQNSRSILSQVENLAEITGTNYVGGLVGRLQGTIEESINRGTVNASSSGGSDIGGLVGAMVDASSDTIELINSYNTGTVEGNSASNTGGLVGRIHQGSIKYSMNIGPINDPNAYSIAGAIDQASRLSQTIAQDDTQDETPETPQAAQAKSLTANELKNVYRFDDWDFSSVWGINVFDSSINDNRPFLQWEGHPVQDIRAEIIPPSDSTLSGIETFTIRAAVGSAHPVGLDNWELVLIQDPDDTSGEQTTFEPTTFGGIRINQSINLNTLFRRNLDHNYVLTVTDEAGNQVTRSATFSIDNPVASGAVNIIEDGDDQIVVNFDSDVSIKDGVTLTGSAFELKLYEFDILNTEKTPDPTTFADNDSVDTTQGKNPTTIDPDRIESVTLNNNQLVITVEDGITLPAGDRFYFRLEFKDRAKENIVNIGSNPLSTTYTRDLVRPLAIRVSDFTSLGLSGSSGFFPRGYTFEPNEDIVVTRLIGGHSGTSSSDIFQLAIYEATSITNPRPINPDDPVIRFELRGAPTSDSNNHHFAQSEYVVEGGGVQLDAGKVYLLVQYRSNGGGAHYRAAGDIDYNQINEFNTRIDNWGPTTGGNWRFIGAGLQALKTATIQTETTRPSLGFRYIIPEDGQSYGSSYTESDAKPD